MRITNRKSTTTETYTINYGNGFTCYVTIVDGVLTHYVFYKKKIRLAYTTKIDTIQDTVWYEYTEEMLKEKAFTLDELKKFDEFDKLFYIGAGYDGLVKDADGNAIKTRLRATDTDTSVIFKLKNTSKITAYIELLKTIPWVSNINGNVKHYENLVFDIIPPNDTIEDIKNLSHRDIIWYFLYKIKAMYKANKAVA